MTRLFKTGKAPGKPKHVGHVLAFGSPPVSTAHEQKIFVAVASCAWISFPITASQPCFIIDISDAVLSILAAAASSGLSAKIVRPQKSPAAGIAGVSGTGKNGHNLNHTIKSTTNHRIAALVRVE